MASIPFRLRSSFFEVSNGKQLENFLNQANLASSSYIRRDLPQVPSKLTATQWNPTSIRMSKETANQIAVDIKHALGIPIKREPQHTHGNDVQTHLNGGSFQRNPPYLIPESQREPRQMLDFHQTHDTTHPSISPAKDTYISQWLDSQERVNENVRRFKLEVQIKQLLGLPTNERKWNEQGTGSLKRVESRDMSTSPCSPFEPRLKDLVSSPTVNQSSNVPSFHLQIGKENEPIKGSIQLYPPHRVEPRFGGLMRAFRQWKEKQLAKSRRMNIHSDDIKSLHFENSMIQPKLIDSSEYGCTFSQGDTSSYSSEYTDDDDDDEEDEEDEEDSICSDDLWSELHPWSKRANAITERKSQLLTFRLKNILGIN